MPRGKKRKGEGGPQQVSVLAFSLAGASPRVRWLISTVHCTWSRRQRDSVTIPTELGQLPAPAGAAPSRLPLLYCTTSYSSGAAASEGAVAVYGVCMNCCTVPTPILTCYTNVQQARLQGRCAL